MSKFINEWGAVLFGLMVMFAVPISIGYEDYTAARSERAVEAEEARRIVQEQEIERNCEWVAFRRNEMMISVELRAKPGVSREQGLKICGEKAFNEGVKVFFDDRHGTAVGVGAVAVAPEQD